jgi:MraZ protein
MYTTRVDDKGRVKLPVDFHDCFTKAAFNRFFITSLDRKIGRIYPITAWRENLKFLAEYCDDPESTETILFNADDLGGEVEMDSQGRLMLPAELRRELAIENQPIRIRGAGAHVEILSEAVYEKRREQASAAASDALIKLRKAGLK